MSLFTKLYENPEKNSSCRKGAVKNIVRRDGKENRMRFARFAQLNHEKRWRRAAALLLALSMLFSFLPVSLIDAVDESEAVISEPNETASPEATVPATDRTDAADTTGIATAPAETDAPETTVPATAAPDAPTTEPTEPAAPPGDYRADRDGSTCGNHRNRLLPGNDRTDRNRRVCGDDQPSRHHRPCRDDRNHSHRSARSSQRRR